MTNEQKAQINEAVKKLELTDYNVLEDIDYNGVKAETVMEVELNGSIFRFKAILKMFHEEHTLFLNDHPLYKEYMKNILDNNLSVVNEPEYVFDGKTIINNENLVAFNTIADKILIDSNDEEAREHLACKLEAGIAIKLFEAEEMLDEEEEDDDDDEE